MNEGNQQTNNGKVVPVSFRKEPPLSPIESMQRNIDYWGDRCSRLERENAKLRAALGECEGYFDSRSDVKDGDYGVPEPNTEMTMLAEIREALGTRL